MVGWVDGLPGSGCARNGLGGQAGRCLGLGAVCLGVVCPARLGRRAALLTQYLRPTRVYRKVAICDKN